MPVITAKGRESSMRGEAEMFYIPRDMRHEVSSEWKVPNGYFDLCDQTTRTLYEIEFHVSKKYRNRKIEQYRMPGFEIIIVDCLKLPADVDEIRRFLEQYVLPD